MAALFKKLLIANRGEIACRIIRTAQKLGVRTVAVYSDADAQALHVEMADEAVHIGASAPATSYLNMAAIIAAAQKSGADALHPGYGFLSENPEFVDAVEAAGIVFVGPSAAAIRAMGLKDAAKKLMVTAGVPVVPGYHGEAQDLALLAKEADKIGYPVLIKARAGGGGKGMRKVDDPAGFADALASAQREGKTAFGDDRVLVEKFVTSPRHIEVQVFGDNHGNVVHLFERDCSLQRRHQKVIEEAPAPGMTDAVRAAMTEAAVTAAKAISYSGAGTIEFIADGSGPLRPDGFWFMEMNTRLQVEHPVTEAITGLDLVEWQLRVAAGETLPLAQDQLEISGHAFEARLYAEDPANSFLPATGTLHGLVFSTHARNDAGIRAGDTITPFYDPMIAKVITHGQTRTEALTKLVTALRATHVAGTVTNASFLAALASHEGFGRGEMDTGLIERNLAGLIKPVPLSETTVALAAITLLGIDPSAPLAGWRQWGVASHTVRLLHAGEVLERRIVLPGDGGFAVEGGAEGVALRSFECAGRQVTARHGATDAHILADIVTYPGVDGVAASLLIEGETYVLTLPDPLATSAQQGDQGDATLAPMTGIVQSVLVKTGDSFASGDKLVVMEAMKMETTICATRAGVVAEVLCAQGDAVEGGAMLVRFEKAES